MTLQVVILAAGQGKRMHSRLPKMLHTLAGKPLLEHVIKTGMTLTNATQPIIIFGHQGEILKNNFSDTDLQWVEQSQQLGTAHALMQALPLILDYSRVLILCGDVPLISAQTLTRLLDTTPKLALGILTAFLPCPFGYGRILRDNNQQIIGIVEEKDATPVEKNIKEINPGVYLVPANYLKKWLPLIKNNNNQKEYYLTDILHFAVNDNIAIHAIQPDFAEEILGVNDKVQLAHLERFYQNSRAEKLMRQGVTVYDPQRLDIRGEVSIGQDVVLDINVLLEGQVKIGDDCVIGAHSILRNVELGNRVVIKPYTLIEGARIQDDCVLGPFSRIRPGTELAEQVHVGNFVEIKKSIIASQTKIGHLSYIGDSRVGKNVNIGAGTITCNYDGKNKHTTTIGDNVFIGSSSQLIAPVTIGSGATIGAGSTITQDVPAKVLALSRVPQKIIESWIQPKDRDK